jgi:hypothetical protein
MTRPGRNADIRDGLPSWPESLGPQTFVAQDRRGAKEYIRVQVRRETPSEQRARQKAFAQDQTYIDATLTPGKPVFFEHVSGRPVGIGL